MDALGKYLRDTMAELKQVSWPTQNQAIFYTILVISISLLVAVYVGLFDFMFTTFIDYVITL
ncbi:preprotein translocase subunit SecE [Candidatus Kaiserbacteria bacterium]|nr:preprotein translocase subunit SecE [Candidatus Kaiserbacteria bacterium]